MNDRDLEIELRDYYRTIDPTTAPRGLAARIDVELDRRRSRWAFLGRLPAAAAGMAAVALVALVIAFRPGGLLTPVGGSPSPATPPPSAPTPSVTPGASPSASPTGPAPSPTVEPSIASLPPVTPLAWSSIDLQPVDNAGGISSVVAWSGGYLALGSNPGTQHGSTVPAWVSGDGRAWTQLPDGTFGTAISDVAAPAPDGVVVLTVDARGTTTAWHSTDGVSWTSSPAPALRATSDGDVAGSANGILAIDQGNPAGLRLSTDGTSWEPVALPGPGAAAVTGVTAFAVRFRRGRQRPRARARPSPGGHPTASPGTAPQVASLPNNKFVEVDAGAGGLVAWARPSTSSPAARPTGPVAMAAVPGTRRTARWACGSKARAPATRTARSWAMAPGCWATGSPPTGNPPSTGPRPTPRPGPGSP